MSNSVNLLIDGIKVAVKPGTTVLDAAKKHGIEIPTLCYDERVEVYGACGLCVVEEQGNPKLLRACSTTVREGMEILTDTPKVRSSRKCALELLLSDHSGDCRPPCVLACPAETDCQGYVGLIANGEYYESVKLIMEKLPLPASIGRVCPHPCETACRRQLVEEPVAIAYLKSFVGDIALEEGKGFKPTIAPDTGKQIAVIGGGPGGLTAAYFLRTKGHSVKVYDMMPEMGGMLLYGIPQYRLPKDILAKEVNNIKALGGIEYINNVRIGKDISFESLCAENDATLIAIGAWVSSKMRVKGEDLEGVLGGIDFLRDVALGKAPEIGQRVAVCGGGNTAMDACRTAVRLGAKEVYVFYRRTREEMPAEDFEIEEALEEGVDFKFLTNPEEFYGKDGKLSGVKLQLMELGEPDADGRRRPVPIEGAYKEIDLDTVIVAIGQKVDTRGFEDIECSPWNTVIADESSYRTSKEGVFAIGDATNDGADIAIAAIGEAHRACDVIDTYLKGDMVPFKRPFLVKKEVTADDFKYEERKARSLMPNLEPGVRKISFDEVALGFSQEAAVKEAARCLECGCNDFFECKLICQANDYDVTPAVYEGKIREEHRETAHPYIEQDAEKCILCGLCVRVCEEMVGVAALGLVNRGFETLVSPEFSVAWADTDCISCGQCVALCPTGALREKSMHVKSVPVSEHSTISTCPSCALACPIDIRTIGNTIVRTLPYGEKGILCAQGRFGHAISHSPARKTSPLIKTGNEYKELTLSQAYDSFSQNIKSVKDMYGPDSIAVLVSDSITSQEAYLAKELAVQAVGTENFFFYGPSEKPIIESLNLKETSKASLDRLFGPSFYEGINSHALQNLLNFKKVHNLAAFKAVIIIGERLPENLPAFDYTVYLGTGVDLEGSGVDLFIPAATYTETQGSFHPADGKTALLKKAPPQPACQATYLTICDLAGSLGHEFDEFKNFDKLDEALQKSRV